MGISQPSISDRIKKDLDYPLENFSGATPYEICQRYAAGDLTRDQLLDELMRWEYKKMDKTDGFDGLLADPRGTFRDVERAALNEIIDLEIYQVLLNHLSK